MKKKCFSIIRRDFEIQTFKAGGKGGQHQNKTDSGVRIIHHESGARGESRNYRSQKQNKDEALRRLIRDSKFKIWLNRKIFNIDEMEKELMKIVDKDMRLENLKIETKVNGGWIQI